MDREKEQNIMMAFSNKKSSSVRDVAVSDIRDNEGWYVYLEMLELAFTANDGRL